MTEHVKNKCTLKRLCTTAFHFNIKGIEIVVFQFFDYVVATSRSGDQRHPICFLFVHFRVRLIVLFEN